MDDITFLILKIVFSVCAALITAYLVPYIKTLKADARYASALDMIDVAVRAAEQVLKTEQGAFKKAEVTKFLREWLERNGIGIMEDELDQLIESFVYQLKSEQKQ